MIYRTDLCTVILDRDPDLLLAIMEIPVLIRTVGDPETRGINDQGFSPTVIISSVEPYHIRCIEYLDPFMIRTFHLRDQDLGAVDV
ncbi:MAG: hypothetical protein QCI82_07290 [Candidatus Thermoplasmatota archaeon]|nr:hypothetical protein [Candidatus Thermoplasmatota archaeon]